MKSRRWIAAAALAAAVVFLVMVTGEHGPATPGAAPAPVSSSEAVLATDGGPSDDGGDEADREEVVDALQGLLDALGISAEDLADGAEGADGADNGGNSNGADNNGGNCNSNDDKDSNSSNGANAQSESDDAGGANCEKPDAASEPSGNSTITIAGFAFGQPLTVAPGASVKVVNSDAAPHNVTAADGSFQTPDLNQDDTATITAPTEPGRYEFTCTLHPEMTGTLIVERNSGGSGAGGQGRSQSTSPTTSSQRSGTSGGDREDSRGERQTTTPGRGTANGSSDGY